MITGVLWPLRRAWLLFLAWTHLSDYAVCEMSRDRGPSDDFHDYVDSEEGPLHFHDHHCVRCYKMFRI